MRSNFRLGLLLSAVTGNAAKIKLLYISSLVLLMVASFSLAGCSRHGTPETELAGPVNQEWTKVFDVKGNQYNHITDVKIDDEGNIFIVGVGTHHNDFCIMKYNRDGKKIWDSHYRGEADYVLNINGQLYIDEQGYVYVTGGSYLLWGTDIIKSIGGFTAKYDSQGERIWLVENIIATESIAVDNEGNVLVTSQWGTIKYDNNGNKLWEKGTGGIKIIVDFEQNVYILEDTAVNKYDDDGNVIWGVGFESATDMVLDNLGNVYITGSSSDSCMTTKYDKDGREVWTALYKSLSTRYDLHRYLHVRNEATAVAIDASGNVYVTGESKGDYVTVKYDDNGNELWVALYGIPEDDKVKSHANDIVLDSAGNVYVTGFKGINCTTVKYDNEGFQEWSADYYGGITGHLSEGSNGLVIAADVAGNVYVGGRTHVKERFDGSANQYYSECLFIKYSSI